jgi:hypothetical protein
MLNCQFFPNSIMKINWSLEGLEIDPWLFDSDPLPPSRNQKTDGSLVRVSKLGTGGCQQVKPKYPLFTHGIRIGVSGGLRPSLLRPLFARSLSLSRNTTSDLARLWRENHAWCALWASRVWYMPAYFWTRKERSSPVCISLWFSRTCKNRGLRFSRPNLLQSVVVWSCFKVSGFINCSIVVEGKF